MYIGTLSIKLSVSGLKCSMSYYATTSSLLQKGNCYVEHYLFNPGVGKRSVSSTDIALCVWLYTRGGR